jgi:hypothetical protein
MHESHVENAAPTGFVELGWTTIHRSDIAPCEPGAKHSAEGRHTRRPEGA